MSGAGASLLFRGGWLAHPAAAPPPEAPDAELAAVLETWHEHAIGGWRLRCDDTWTLTRGRAGEAEVVVLGIAMDVTAPAKGAQALADGLAAALAASWERFYAAIDDLSGAHVLFVRSGDRLRVIADATGMEMVAYDAGGGAPLLAAHPALLAELRGRPLTAAAQRRLTGPGRGTGTVTFPGLQTPYEGVRMHTPNSELDPDALAVHRFWPREPIEQRPVADIAERVAPWLRNQFRWLADNERALVSLTGGLDTRLALAASRDVAGELGYYTWVVWNSGVHLRDLEVAGQLATRLGLRHEVFRISRAEPADPAFAQAWERMHRGAQGSGALPQGLLTRYPAGHVDVRSILAALPSSLILRLARYRPDVISPLAMAGAAFGVGGAREARRDVQEYMHVTGFSRRSKRNVHWADLFYWEQRAPKFHGAMTLSLKVVHPSYSILNCRNLLATMLGRPIGDRVGRVLWYALIDHLWPEVLDVPVFSGTRFVPRP